MTERIRIAHILPWPHVGGTEIATLRIAKSVAGERFEHIPYVLPGDTPCRRLFHEEGFETAEFPAVQPSWSHPGTWWHVTSALARDMLRRNITLMHCSDLLAAHRAAWAATLARLPILCHVRNRFESISLRDRTFLAPVRRFAFVSHNTWRRFGYQVPARRGEVIYDGIDVHTAEPSGTDVALVRAEFGIPGGVPLIGMVSRIAPQKDYETLIRAATRLRQAGLNLRFLLIGDFAAAPDCQDYYRRLRKLIYEARLDDWFQFTGHRKDVKRLLAALDIFVLSTHLEGLPLAILEAMALAKPVLATAVDGVPEVVQDGVTGLLHTHQSDAQLAEHVSRLVAFPELAKGMGLSAQSLVKTSFSTAQFAKAITARYEQMARSAR